MFLFKINAKQNEIVTAKVDFDTWIQFISELIRLKPNSVVSSYTVLDLCI